MCCDMFVNTIFRSWSKQLNIKQLHTENIYIFKVETLEQIFTRSDCFQLSFIIILALVAEGLVKRCRPPICPIRLSAQCTSRLRRDQ